jgi:hypothetical protein
VVDNVGGQRFGLRVLLGGLRWPRGVVRVTSGGSILLRLLRLLRLRLPLTLLLLLCLQLLLLCLLLLLLALMKLRGENLAEVDEFLLGGELLARAGSGTIMQLPQLTESPLILGSFVFSEEKHVPHVLGAKELGALGTTLRTSTWHAGARRGRFGLEILGICLSGHALTLTLIHFVGLLRLLGGNGDCSPRLP